MPHSKVSRDHTAARALPRVSVTRAAGLGAAIALTSLIGLPAAAAPQETVLYSFSGGADGGHPEAGLVMDGNGALYGTTRGAGGGTDGTVFMLAPPGPGRTGWSKTTLHRFTGGDDGGDPEAGLIMDASGALYGTTEHDGGADSGTVFMLTPPVSGETRWTETVLHALRGGADGAKPSAGLIMDASGALYGTTSQGGGGGCFGQPANCGTVFMLTPPVAGETRWTETVLHSFTGGADGADPHAGLVMDTSGALYGTTSQGGGGRCFTTIKSRLVQVGCGTVFKLAPPAAGGTDWTEKVLYGFTGGGDPEAGLIMDASGALYGTTEHGGGDDFGTVFMLTPPVAGETRWTETVLHTFTGGADGFAPLAGLIMDASGALYGTTWSGGPGCVGANCGTVFKLTPPASGETRWTETVLHSFTGGADGADPGAGVIMDASGALYGTTVNGGGRAPRCGTVFKVVP